MTDAIFGAVDRGSSKQVQALLEGGEASVVDVDEHGQSLLQHAIMKSGRHDCISILLAAGADIAQEDDYGLSEYKPPIDGLFGVRPDFEQLGMSELHAAVRGWGSTSFDLAIASTPRASIDERDLQGRTALSFAAEAGSVHIVRELLLKGADPRIKDTRRRIPLHFWAGRLPEDERVSDELLHLLGYGDSINHKDNYDTTVLHRVCISSRATDTLLAKLMVRGADINVQGAGGYTALHYAIEYNLGCGIEVVNWLAKNGADMRARDRYGRTPAMLALIRHRSRILELLLALGADYTSPTIANINVLHIAAFYGKFNTLRVLQDAEIALQCPESSDTNGFTPMESAQWRKNCNTKWADMFFEVADDNPQRWFEAFEAMYHSVVQRSEAIDWTSSSDSLSATDAEEEACNRLPGSFPDD
ncbi:hypothetical protein MMC18_001181 [Xylographa bjoerkii]|nr:hypothetical protein [Xylographa bjoerkii]